MIFVLRREGITFPFNFYCRSVEDGYYRYAVIIKVGPGLYPDVEEVQWFERYVDGTIATIDRPKQLEQWYPYIIG